LNGGLLNQPGGVVVSSSLDWAGGTNIAGTGTTRLLSGGTFTMTGTTTRTLTNGIVENRGTATWSGNFQLSSGSGGILRNVTSGGPAATFTLTGDGVFL